jgi:hypothetical protein
MSAMATDRDKGEDIVVDDAPQRADSAVQLAHDVDEKTYSPWSKGLLKLYLVLVIPYLCGCLNGYDGSLMGGIIAMTSYQNIFKM